MSIGSIRTWVSLVLLVAVLGVGYKLQKQGRLHWNVPGSQPPAQPESAAVAERPKPHHARPKSVAKSKPVDPGELIDELNEAITWPPKLNEVFPDLILQDAKGGLFPLSSLKGRVILLEPVGMTCPACQSWSGGRQYGAFGDIQPQADLTSIDDYIRKFGGISGDDGRLAKVQILFYNLSMKPPSHEEVVKWSEHFRLNSESNTVILGGTQRFQTPETHQMVPGFLLIDKDFVLRSIAGEWQPSHDLAKLLSLTGEFVREEGHFTIEAAYQSIPHRQTLFNILDAQMPTEEKVYLQRVFDLVDLAIAQKVQAQHWLFFLGGSGRPAKNYQARVKTIIARLQALHTPEKLKEVATLIQQALQEHQKYFQEWEDAQNGLRDFPFRQVPKLGEHPAIKSSSQKLRRAYSLLKSMYPDEDTQNEQALFDYLCALDFQ